MSAAARVALVLGIALGAAACGPPPEPTRRFTSAKDLPGALAEAFREEQRGDPERAARGYLDVVRAASRDDGPWAPAAAAAALEALVWRSVPGVSDVAPKSALAFRVRVDVAKELAAIHAGAPNVPVRGLVAKALSVVAETRGDAALAQRARTARGCASDVTVLGPRSWAIATGPAEAGPVDGATSPLPAQVRMPGPFDRKVAPVAVSGRGCSVDLATVAAGPGVRDVVVDAKVERAGRIWVSMTSSVPTRLRVGGKVVLERPFEPGPVVSIKTAEVVVDAGRLRLVAHAAMPAEGGRVEIDAWDDSGQPLALSAPKPGEAARSSARSSRAVVAPEPKRPEERLTVALGALALGDLPTAEAASATPKAPDLAIAHARVLEHPSDLPAVQRAERARAAVDLAHEAWPDAWEPTLQAVVLQGVRRSGVEARLESLKELERRRSGVSASGAPLLDALEVALCSRSELVDRARPALERAKRAFDGTPIAFDLARAAEPRGPADLAKLECSTGAPRDRSSFACYSALLGIGQYAQASSELDELRKLYGAPNAFGPVELREALDVGDVARVRAASARLLPGEWTLSQRWEAGKAMGAAPKLAELLYGRALVERDAPQAIPPLLRASGDDPIAGYDERVKKLVDDDRKAPAGATAATLVLFHEERYDVLPTGLTHAFLVDVRRVGGTSDIESNAQAGAADVGGRTAFRSLRRRIHKKDGRVVLPERSPNAAQAHADLAQLEQGDYVEAIYESWSIPSDLGTIAIDTPDLLPERTAVKEAHVVVTIPEGVPVRTWSHPLLGKPLTSAQGTTRRIAWAMRDHAVRRLEDGVPKMDRSVSVVVSTLEWADVARALRETLGAMDDRSPDVGAFARAAIAPLGAAATERQKVDAVVRASGEAIKQASGVAFMDAELGPVRASSRATARTFLATREGSRSWLVARALRELGIEAEIVVAEREPYSGDPAFVPHVGRFSHPLVVARPKDAKGDREVVLVDADVPGPPLPAGRVSPQLRGRSVLYGSGRIEPLPEVGGADERDEVDLRLTVDKHGDAKGSLTVLLRGREAQELAEAFVHIVGPERDRALRGVALAWVPYANVDSVQLSSTEGSWQVAVRADLSAAGFAQLESREKGAAWVLPGMEPLHFVFPRAFSMTLGSAYARGGARENALAISSSALYHVRRRTELPEGAKVVKLPGPLAVKNLFVAERKVGVDGQVIEEDFVLALPTGTVPKEQYGAFVQDIAKTDDAFLFGVRVKPPAP